MFQADKVKKYYMKKALEIDKKTEMVYSVPMQ